MTTPATANDSDTATTWQIDPARSRVSFAVHKRQLVVPRRVRGRFTEVAGTIALNAAQPSESHVAATIQTASVTTGNSMESRMRDKHLRGRDFLDVERYPAITFESRVVTPVDPAAGSYRISGDLTIHGVTRPVELETHAAPEQDPRLPRLSFSATTVVNRRDFGLTWRAWYLGVGDELAISIDIEAVRA
ncbi:MAG TPA: YceI family protein [Dehalococcoidia bacterium]|nr:YceI family protein [Dehalococcoidia bacterium]